ncbi:MAG: OmpA family protein [Proteobacteria bacterium]|nr:OmpA family protein [Pseudomonadota bacterium]
MAGKGRDRKGKGTVIIKKFTIEEGGHHGGAWKVAYADFVTAMMAFFLLMWLLNATTEDQRKGLADYFSPSNLMSHNSSGTGQPFGGHTAFDNGAMVSDRGAVQVTNGQRPIFTNVTDGPDPVAEEPHRAPEGEGVGQGSSAVDYAADLDNDKVRGDVGPPRPPGTGGPVESKLAGPNTAPGLAAPREVRPDAKPDTVDPMALTQAELDRIRAAREEAERKEKAAFDAAAEQIKEAVRSDPALADLAKQLAIDITPQGLRIQILDEVKVPMFPTGSARPNERARLLIQKVAPVLMKLDRPISVTGHTDAAPFPGPDRTNWELSAERANATRRLLSDGGFPDNRVSSVSGHADREPLLPAEPLAAANRRIAILVLRQALSPDGRLPPVTP